MNWTWDQGRQKYFEVAVLRKMAQALLECRGADLSTGDPIREVLQERTGADFRPPNYTVWRNYSRVIGRAHLALRIDGKLVVSETAEALADEIIDTDQYLAIVAGRYISPHPCEQAYSESAPVSFPMAQIIKRCAIHALNGGTGVNLEEACSLSQLGLSGKEPLAAYADLSSYSPQGAESDPRQVREMLSFLGQLSWLCWDGTNLFFDLPYQGNSVAEFVDSHIIEPHSITEGLTAEEQWKELARLDSALGSLVDFGSASEAAPSQSSQGSAGIAYEGRKQIRYHASVERSSKVRESFISAQEFTGECDLCGVRADSIYPWLDHQIEVHHLLPLSSPILDQSAETCLDDLVGLCPNCHRATHKFYRIALKDRGAKDFSTRDEAVATYEAVRNQMNQS